MRTFLLLWLLPCWLSAQSDFLKNKNIVWAAEIEQDWIVDGPNLEDEFELGLKTLKLLRTKQNEPYLSNVSLAALVHHDAMSGALPIFDDPKCTRPLNPRNRLIRIDTVVTFDPETYEEKILVVANEYNPYSEYKAWRLHQILYYNQKTSSWNTVVTAIAPMIKLTDYAADTSSFAPLYWFKPSDDRPKLTKNSIVWAKETKTRQPATIINTNQPQMLKVFDGFQFPLEHSIRGLIYDPKLKVYHSYDDEKLMTMDERFYLAVHMDTIVTFDPETYEEKVVVIRNEINQGDIKRLRLFQTWYWDERKHRLSICTDMAGPVIEVMDSEGNFRYEKPLYYIKTSH